MNRSISSPHKPTITIVTVCYNAERCIEKTIKSVIGQTYDDYEYLIIDGESTDGTLDIIKKYEQYVTRIISEPDKGIYDAMNKAIGLASGEWINFMNAGDVFASADVLSNVFSVEYPDEVKFLYSDNYKVDRRGRRTLSRNDHTIPAILHQSSIYRRRLHERYGLYVVTPKIIISDFLFFCALPESSFRKTNTIISANDEGGVSSGLWCGTQRLCAMVVFRKISFGYMLYRYIRFRVGRAFPFLRKLKRNK